MWTRIELKDRAKIILKNHYWIMLLVSIIMSIVGVDSKGFQMNWRNSGSPRFTPFWNPQGLDFHMTPSEVVAAIIIGITAFAVVIIFFIAIRVLLGYAVDVGGRKFFMQAAQGNVEMSMLGYAFRKDKYVKIIITMLRKDIQIFLWSLLFIIPGIIKAFSYFLVPYILAENPGMGSGEAIEMSKRLMEGHKWDTFVLGLSFIGWYFLGALAMGIGTIFVTPYVRATNAELYLRLKEIGLQKGLCQTTDFVYESYTEA